MSERPGRFLGRRIETNGRPARIVRTLAVAALALALFLAPGAAPGQVPGASPSALGRAHGGTALARGTDALALNPAGLGAPDSPGFSLTLPVIQMGTGLGPVGLSDLARHQGEVVPGATKKDWLRRVEAGGGEDGSGTARITPLALSVGRVGLQVSTVAAGSARLNPDAVELLLFGNSGRTGTAGEYELESSRLDLFGVTTVAAGAGLPVLEDGDRRVAIGATGKYTLGHVLVLARDEGSAFRTDPLSIEVDLPVLHTRSGAGAVNGGGLGLDLGAWAETGRWSVGAAVHDALSTFAWDEEAMAYRPGSALFEGDRRSSELAERPLDEAPEELREELEEAGFGPKLSVGAAYRASDALTVSADARHRLGTGLGPGPRTRIGAALETTAISFLPLRAGAATTSDGMEIGGGGSLVLGPVDLTAGALLRRGDTPGTAVVIGLSYGRDVGSRQPGLTGPGANR